MQQSFHNSSRPFTSNCKIVEDFKIDASHLKGKYSIRKYISKEYTKFLLRDDAEHLGFFNRQKKADDLGDAYLQGIWERTPSES